MIAVVQHRRGKICVAACSDVGSLVVWKTSDGCMWLKSWVRVLEELEVRTMNEAQLVYPEYFV